MALAFLNQKLRQEGGGVAVLPHPHLQTRSKKTTQNRVKKIIQPRLSCLNQTH